MQATQESEPTYRVNIRLPDRKYRTRLSYTMEQAKEINDIVAESMRSASGYFDEIVMDPIKVTEKRQ